MPIPWLPYPRGYRLQVHRDPIQAALPAPTELNYDVPHWRIARPMYSGINMFAGLNQWGWMQSFHQAYLPPPTRVGPIQKIRNVGGVYGAGTISASTVRIPSVLVPRGIG